MRRLRLLWRAFLALVLVLVAVTVGTSVYFRIVQYRYRRQAERLLSDVRTLELGRPSPAAVKRVVDRWGFDRSLPHDKPCTDDDCNYYCQFMTPDHTRLYEHFGSRNQESITRILAMLGQRPACVRARVQMRGKAIRSVSFSVYTLGRAEDGNYSTLMAYADTKGEGSFSAHDKPDVKLRHSLLHPSYLAGAYPATLNVDTFTPSPAEIIWEEFSPDGNGSDVSRLMQFDLSCLTRISSCRDRDLMPGVWAQTVEDGRASAKSLTCTPELSKRVAQLSDVIAVVRPKAVELSYPRYDGWPLQLPDLEIVSVIKKPKYPRQLGRLDVGVDGPEMTTTADMRSSIRAGQQYLFLLQVHDYRASGWIELYPCGVLTLNDANLAMVREVAAISEQGSE